MHLPFDSMNVHNTMSCHSIGSDATERKNDRKGAAKSIWSMRSTEQKFNSYIKEATIVFNRGWFKLYVKFLLQ